MTKEYLSWERWTSHPNLRWCCWLYKLCYKGFENCALENISVIAANIAVKKHVFITGLSWLSWSWSPFCFNHLNSVASHLQCKYPLKKGLAFWKSSGFKFYMDYYQRAGSNDAKWFRNQHSLSKSVSRDFGCEPRVICNITRIICALVNFF